VTVKEQLQGKIGNGLKVAISTASNGSKVTPYFIKVTWSLLIISTAVKLCASVENPNHLPDQKSLTEIFHRV
jgi:hypothetical protein